MLKHEKLISQYFLLSLLLVSSGLFVWACGSASSENRPVDAMVKQVIDIHDKVMPKMGNMTKLQKDLRKEIEELEGQDTADAERVAAMKTAVAKLESAKAGMRNWMKEFEHPSAEQAESEALKYLESELKKVEQLRDDILSSLKQAENLMK